MHAAGLAGPRIDSFAHIKDLSPLTSFSKVQSFGITPTATGDAAAAAATAAAAGMGGMVNDASGGAGGAAAVHESLMSNNNNAAVPTTTATTMLPPPGSSVQTGGSGNSHLTPRGLGRQDSGVSAGEGDNPGGSGSGGARPIKRSRRASETVGDGSGGGGLPVNEFEGVDLAGISRKFPQARVVVVRFHSLTHSLLRSLVSVRVKTAYN